MKKRAKAILLTALALILTVSLASCGGTQEAQTPSPVDSSEVLDENTEFIFRGSGTATNGRTLSFVITGNKDETLDVTVEELPILHMGGTWTLIDGKGYKLYFEDGNYEYTKYDPDAGEFTFTSSIETGSYGSPSVDFSFQDTEFASVYDGEGLGRKPPVFDMVGWWGGILEANIALTCMEDGTFTAGSRTGVWSFDEVANAYSFEFDAGVLFVDGREITEAGWKLPPRGHPEVPVEEYVDRGYALGREDTTRMTWEEYEALNYGKGPCVTTYDASTGAYSLEILVDFIQEELTLFKGTCIYADQGGAQ